MNIVYGQLGLCTQKAEEKTKKINKNKFHRGISGNLGLQTVTPSECMRLQQADGAKISNGLDEKLRRI